MASPDFSSLNRWQVWALAARPKTLPAAAAPVIVGVCAAFQHGDFRAGPAFAALLGALLLQIGANLANDLFDFKKGADTAERLGPLRVTQAGLLSPREVAVGMWVVFALAALVGVYLVYVGGWPILLIGLFSIVSALAYTGGPYPLGYNGLGDIFVFIFFGLFAVGGTYYVQAGTLHPVALWSAVPMGLLATAILVVNNLRDIDTDRKAGKKTLAVRLGVRGVQREYIALLAGAWLIPLMMWAFGVASGWVLLTWLTGWMGFRLIHTILHEKGRALNQALAATGRFELIYGILLGIGLLLR